MWGREKKCRHFPDEISNAISWIKLILLNISLECVPKGPIDNIPSSVQIWLDAGQVTSHYLNQWWLDFWRIYAALSLNELNTTKTQHNPVIERVTELNFLGLMMYKFVGGYKRWKMQITRCGMNELFKTILNTVCAHIHIRLINLYITQFGIMYRGSEQDRPT